MQLIDYNQEYFQEVFRKQNIKVKGKPYFYFMATNHTQSKLGAAHDFLVLDIWTGRLETTQAKFREFCGSEAIVKEPAAVVACEAEELQR